MEEEVEEEEEEEEVEEEVGGGRKGGNSTTTVTPAPSNLLNCIYQKFRKVQKATSLVRHSFRMRLGPIPPELIF